MRIYYDGYIYAQQPTGGINRYFAQLIKRLPESCHPVLGVSRYGELDRPSHPNLRLLRYKRFRPTRISWKLESLYFAACAARRYDLVHPTHYLLLSQRKIRKRRAPLVITVHDMIHEIFTSTMDPSGEHAAAKRAAIAAAQAVICNSENTKRDVLERYPQAADKVFVTPLAQSLDPRLSYGDEPTPARPYFIYVGSRAGEYKNFGGLLSAFARVVSVHPDTALCVVGAAFTPAEEKLIAELGLGGNVELYRHADDKHLSKLYRRSVALVYPSLYEGFGIPPLEAMACGTAVVASDSSSIPEVVGDAAVLFDPKSKDDLVQALLHVLENTAERERLIARGQRRAELFSWDRTARETFEVYKSVCASVN